MGYRALIIEDDHALADALRMRLSREGHEVTIAGHQQEAYRLLDQSTFDFVLLDLRLPADKADMQPNAEVGFDILGHIRDRFSPDELPVIDMTAYEETSQTAVRALIKAFANDYITKPFEDSTESLDTKLSRITQRLASARPDQRRHKIIFRRDCVEINGIEVTGKARELLVLLANRASLGTPDAATDSGPMSAKDIATKLEVVEQTVRQLIRRFRKTIATAHRERGLVPIGKQDIIRNDRDWKGYSINLETSYIIRG